MKSTFRLEFASMTDTGMVRSHNEDSIIVNADLGLAILADGMGGYNAGEIASAMATSIVQHAIEKKLHSTDVVELDHPAQFVAHILGQSAVAANTAIFEAGLEEPAFSGMGTTLATVLFYENAVAVAHIGDSRVYRLRDNVLMQLTRDHSLLQEQLDAGLINQEQAQFAQHKNLITRAVGVDLMLEADINDFFVLSGDQYLLCSDGLSDMLTDAQMANIMTTGSDINEVVSTLVARANEEGGRDNISAILIRAQLPDPADAPSLATS